MSIADAPAPDRGTDASRSSSARDEVRRERGRAILALGNVRMDGKDNRYRVTSQTGERHYLVSIDRKKGPDWRCECRDWETREKPCKHVYAVKFAIERDEGGGVEDAPKPARKAPTFAEQEALAAQAVPPRPTYKQDWPA